MSQKGQEYPGLLKELPTWSGGTESPWQKKAMSQVMKSLQCQDLPKMLSH